jgi:hypothetical protein
MLVSPRSESAALGGRLWPMKMTGNGARTRCLGPDLLKREDRLPGLTHKTALLKHQ